MWHQFPIVPTPVYLWFVHTEDTAYKTSAGVSQPSCKAGTIFQYVY